MSAHAAAKLESIGRRGADLTVIAQPKQLKKHLHKSNFEVVKSGLVRLPVLTGIDLSAHDCYRQESHHQLKFAGIDLAAGFQSFHRLKGDPEWFSNVQVRLELPNYR